MNELGRTLLNLAVLAIILVGIARFSRPQSARLGNLLIALAMFFALGFELVGSPPHAPALALAAFALGSLAGIWTARRINMTQIPALVGFQNGAGGLASCLVSLVEMSRQPHTLDRVGVVAALAALVVGSVTFSGSMVAAAKLAGWMRQKPSALPGHRALFLSLVVLTVAAALGAAGLSDAARTWLALVVGLVSLALGIVFSVRVGGADMPVLISLLNALSGLSAGICGIVVKSHVLTACGATVAASGLILTYAMCLAMNRSLWAILWPVGAAAVPSSPAVAAPQCESGSPDADRQRAPGTPAPDPFDRAVEALRQAQKIIVIPGYGMALAHAQVATVQLANRLSQLGKKVKFAIHPLAGRMPGHMHVLLAEAEVDPDILFDLGEVNSEFSQTDLALVVGACDVVNPAAASVEGTPISGMPILAAHEARHAIVCNLDARPGYSGVENLLYQKGTTILLLGDAQQTVSRLLASMA